MFDPREAIRKLERRPADHKGRFGHVLVLAGSTGYLGAARLAARAALVSGAGLVTLGVPRTLWPIAAAKLTACMTRPFKDVGGGAFALGGLGEILDFAQRSTVVALGPGIGTHPSTVRLVQALVRTLPKSLVLDADGLNALAGRADVLEAAPAPRVLTPHPGEMSRLAGRPTAEVQADREGIARDFARRHGVVLTLKGHATVVTDGDRLFVNSTGNPGMASGGAGDVLTGMVAALMGQGLEPFEAAALGVHAHGLAGDIAAARLGQLSLEATALLDAIPEAFQQLQRRTQGSE